MACNCGYWWEDLNDYGEPISLAYCHYDGPDEWAPCAQNEYDEYANEVDVEAREAEEEYERWLEEQSKLVEDEEHWTHEFGQPYDYQEW